jgi:O-antigen ligase
LWWVLFLGPAPPLRSRVVDKARELQQGSLDALLTGRLDGWRVAAALLGEHPLAGVGHGAYRAEFARTKVALAAAGTPFFAGHLRPSFANAHNEVLEVGADLGWPGLLALAWAVAVAARALSRRGRGGSAADAALLGAGAVALALLCLAQFPFRVATLAYPWLAFLAWGLGEGRQEGGP